MTRQKVTVGVDVGGTNTILGFIDEDGNYLTEASFGTQDYGDLSNFLLKLTNTIQDEYQKISKKYELSGVAIAAPSANYFEGTIEGPANLSWGQVNLVSILKQHIKLPVVVINDANAAALGEMMYGTAKEMKNFVVITLGTGVGSGIVINGDIFYGAHCLAGELGHITAIPNGRQCGCGKSGCLETYTSANGVVQTAIDLLDSSKSKNSILKSIYRKKLTSKMVAEAALNNDALALEVFEYTGKILGKNLADIVACFDPEAIILSGGLSNAGDILLNPTRRHFESNLLDLYKHKCKLLLSKMTNGRAAIMGASSLISK